MKLTWFGGTTMRIHIGGAMFVLDADGAPANIDRTELVSGADRLISFATLDQLAEADPSRWQPRRAGSLIEERELPEVQIMRTGDAALVVDAIGERPLILTTAPLDRFGRWSSNAVVVVMGDPATLPAVARAALDHLTPHLIAVAGPEASMDQVILAIASTLDGTGLVSLDPGLALEV